MRECFGCLANSVAFLHSKKVAIKHKDIKPSNILMFRGTPIITDFGISNSFKDKDHSTSSGFTVQTTLYAAPEVIWNRKRNTSQDVFALGLVFLDMYWSLLGKFHKRSDFDGIQREEAYPGTMLDEVDRKFAGDVLKLAFEQSPTFHDLNTFLRIIRLMTAVELEQRPSADSIWNILKYPTFFGQTCGDCCLPETGLDKTMFTQWSGLQTYMPNHPRTPYDQCLPDDESPEEPTLLRRQSSDLALTYQTQIPSSLPKFDWTGQNRGFHVTYESEELVPMSSIATLGSGSSGIVEAVRCNGRPLARKTIRLFPGRFRSRSIQETIRTEIAVMRRLSHRHVTQLIGTYSTKRSFSMLIYPVCQYDLKQLMEECEEMRQQQSAAGVQRARWIRITAKRSAQCMAQALEYLHENQVRHSDIKPSNVLYKISRNGGAAHVYLTDFDISKMVEDYTETGTTGIPRAFTRQYAPPETLNAERRGRSIDVFSLGCIFKEILAMLLCAEAYPTGRYLPYAQYLNEFHAEVESLGNHNGVVEGLRIPRRQITRFADLIISMTQEIPDDRPLAADVAQWLGANDCCYLEPEDIADDHDAEHEDVAHHSAVND